MEKGGLERKGFAETLPTLKRPAARQTACVWEAVTRSPASGSDVFKYLPVQRRCCDEAEPRGRRESRTTARSACDAS